ncbi:retinol dehydrogenase 14 [Parasteatoda tepidariorum]|uniref:retinol dehydrogenase 14 n=1 Tax=Parasteatoda tepidariorum TaxID=114398 RepID=UPI0039BC355D
MRDGINITLDKITIADTIMAPAFNTAYVLFTATCYVLYCFIGCVFLLGLFLKIYLVLKSKRYRSGISMVGKTVLITGANSGIGKAIAYDLAERSARVIMACRNLTEAAEVAEAITCSTGNENIIVKHLDLSSFKSVRKCAREIIRGQERLDVLINNAGIGVNLGPDETEDGNETIMQTNYLGHFLLTTLLLDILRQSSPSRIINVASSAYRFSNLEREDLDFSSTEDYSDQQKYANSNLAKIMFARELALKLLNSAVTVNTVCLDLVNTSLFYHSTSLFSKFLSYMTFLFGQTPVAAAQTAIKLAVDPSLEKTNGQLFKYCKKVEFCKIAKDRKMSQALYRLSEKNRRCAIL